MYFFIQNQENEGFEMLDSGIPKFSRRRPMPAFSLVAFKQETAFHTPINQIFGPARGQIYLKNIENTKKYQKIVKISGPVGGMLASIPSRSLTCLRREVQAPKREVQAPKREVQNTQKTNPSTQKTSPSTQKTNPSIQKTIPSTQLTNPGTRPQKM